MVIEADQPERGGTLVLVGTPVGNRGDLSPRATEAVLGADLLFCEDTRSPSRLWPDTPLPPRRSCFVGNEHERTDLLLAALGEGKTVAYVSEAGMPAISDPGQRLVAAARDAGYDIDVIPGPTAAVTALCQSGFSSNKFMFVGFVPRSGADRSAAMQAVAEQSATVIMYEAGNRTAALLRDLAAACPDATTRKVCVARELTKLHQDVRVGALQAMAEANTAALRGEVSVVLQGTDATVAKDAAHRSAQAVLDAMLDPDARPRDKAKRIAEATGLDARAIYERLSGR